MTDRILVVASHPDDETLGCGGRCCEWQRKARFVPQSFEVVGVDVSEHALAATRSRVATMSQPPELRLVETPRPSKISPIVCQRKGGRDVILALPGRDLEIGEFGFRFRGTSTRHWIVTYRTKIDD